MVQTVKQLLNDKAWARWTALILIASMMFFAYMFVDVMSPIQALMESEKGWGPDTFGTYAASEYIVNVMGFLIIAGIILDKMGVRFTGVLSASMMFIGALIKLIGISDWFATVFTTGSTPGGCLFLPAPRWHASASCSSVVVVRWQEQQFQRPSQSGSRARRWLSPWVSRWLSPVWVCSPSSQSHQSSRANSAL